MRNYYVKKDNFLTSIIGVKCASVDFTKLNSIENLNEYKFLYSKTGDDANITLKAKDLGFYLVDVAITMKKDNDHYVLKLDNNFLYEKANKEHSLELQNIASKSFENDRFQNDPKISYNIASKIKKEWIANFFKGERGDNCFIATHNKKVIGFLLAIKNNDNIIIDLIAVDKKYRGLGVGKNLIKFTQNYYRNTSSSIEVGTQLRNKESIKLYNSLGFQFISHNLVWHYHN